MHERTTVVTPESPGTIALGSYRRDALAAARAAISVFVPLAALWATGHLDLSVYAALGSLAS